ncbi:MAG: 2-amino-4-hydroxy-6-hydroxymethyldihydropteridine diphosphokinase [Odoribacter sp.]|nr:2-amino-4-hydroxy-6-hydroxymethyldihydropteridine diphosphokinase [Odoribacter sp.]
MQAVTIFGSNSGPREKLITQAIRQLSEAGKIVLSSSFYETEPWGFECHENFLNQITVFETLLSPEEFLKTCLDIEKQLGRIRLPNASRYSSRPIDIDLLFYDSRILETPDLILPHPRLCERNFVLVPLAEIMPEFVHPVTGKTIAELLAASPDRMEVKKLTIRPDVPLT